MAKTSFRVQSKKEQNKKLAIRLLFSLIVLIGLYFGCIRAGFAAIQDIYIYAAFVLMMVYALFAVLTEREKRKNNRTTSDTREASDTLTPLAQRYNRIGKYALILFIPMLFALLIDYMILLLGFADLLGI